MNCTGVKQTCCWTVEGSHYNTCDERSLFSGQYDKSAAYTLNRDARARLTVFFNISSHILPPDAVEHVSVLEYPQQFVVRRDLVEVCSLFIREEQVGFPNGVQH